VDGSTLTEDEQMTAILEDGKLRLSGYVGAYYYEDGFTSSDVVIALAGIDDEDDLDVHLNSGGGLATEGAAIHALLSARSGTTNIVVEGIAASAASLIAMAGETVTMSAGAVMMIHDPSGWTQGTSQDHAKTIEGLEALATAYSRVYAQKSGKSPEECRLIMKEERWLTPEQAVEQGFADATISTKASAVAAYDYRAYAHAPKRLTALASKKNWRLESVDAPAAPAATPNRQPSKESTMSGNSDGGNKTVDIEKEKSQAAKDAVASYQARRKSVMALPESKGREGLAETLIDTDLAEDAIKVALAAAPAGASTESEQPLDPKAYEASRAAGAGVGGKPTTQSNGTAPSLAANMRKLLGKDAA
jgi:ATP-dependent Clp protease protease subunit